MNKGKIALTTMLTMAMIDTVIAGKADGQVRLTLPPIKDPVARSEETKGRKKAFRVKKLNRRKARGF